MLKKFVKWNLSISMIVSSCLPLLLQTVSNVYADPSTTSTSPDYSNDKVSHYFQSFEDRVGFLETTVDVGKGDANVVGLPDNGLVTKHVDPDSIEGSSDFHDGESKDKLFDGNVGSKFLTNDHIPTPENPVWVSFRIDRQKVISRYEMVAANDAPTRDPSDWIFFGSVDGVQWVELDRQENQVFTERFERKEFPLTPTDEYSYFKLEITKNAGDIIMTQLAELALITEDLDETAPYMVSKISNGPPVTWNQRANAGWTGRRALEVSGEHVGSGRAYSYNTIYKDLSIPVTEKTNFSYTIFPSMLDEANYDFDFTQMYTMIDLKFDDGTYLSELSAVNQDRVLMTPKAQAEGRILNTNQWNYVNSVIGEVATGKVITEILVVYDNDSNPKEGNAPFATYFDDIEIYDMTPNTYDSLAEYVNILRGTNSTSSFSRGLTVPAVTSPHGFNFWAPSTNSGSNTIYEYQKRELVHMTVSHEPSIWVGDRGTWQFMVNTSIDADDVSDANQINSEQRKATYSHENEVGKAHYYSVTFDEDTAASGAQMEVTPTEHAAVVRFTYPSDAPNQSVILDSVRGPSAGLSFLPGNRIFQAYSDDTSNGMKRMYIYGVFSEAATSVNAQGRNGIATFDADDGVIEMKVATSFISYDQARKNLELEIKDNETFNDIYTQSKDVWNEKLSVIEVEGASEEEMITLYSNMYRLFMYPNTLSENVGTAEQPVWKYTSPYEGTVANPVVKDGILYYNNGFWDTYRTTWAAYGLLTPTKNSEMLDGLVAHYHDQGWVPRWIAPGGTNSMVGTSSDIIFADAMVKGYDFDWENAYLSALRNASVVSNNLVNGGRAQLATSIFRGYTSSEQHEGFSWSMEGYLNDYGIYQMSKALGYDDEAAYYLNRALGYTYLFGDEGPSVDDKWFRGRMANGEYSYSNEEFDPFFWGDDYTETNAYNMSVSVVHDGQGLANLYGGRDELAKKLDTIFETNGPYSGYGAINSVGGIHEQKEAREVKLGQYGHSNQPSHHIPYMYNFAGQPWKTQYYVRDVLRRTYTGATFGQGYIGDEDNGEMSAWYIFSALGFYPVAMGNDEFAIGSPLFDKVTVHLENGNTLEVIANNNSDDNVYVQSLKVNGEQTNKNYITHDDIFNGGTLEFTMGDTPNTSWGSGEDDLPTSITEEDTMPEPLKDTTIPNAVVSDEPIVGDIVLQDTIFSNVDARLLFDNTSATVAALEAQTDVYYSFEQPTEVQMLTLTSGDAEKAPSAFVLSGSLDGITWEELEGREDIQFEWNRYTRPFLVNTDAVTSYTHYKLSLFEGSELAQVEMIGTREGTSEVTKAMLQQAYDAVKALDQSDMSKALQTYVNETLDRALIVLENDDATQAEIVDVYNALLTILRSYDNYHDVEDVIPAQEYVDASSGVVDNVDGSIGGIKNNSWLSYNILFHGDVTGFKVEHSVQDDSGGTMYLHLDNKDAEPFAEVKLDPTGSWNTYVYQSIDVILPQNTYGFHTLYVTFSADDGNEHVANIKSMQFTSQREIPVESITIEPDNVILKEGETAQLTAIIMPENADNQDVVWQSVDESIATVDSSGLVQAISSGETVISATTVDGNIKAIATITVTPLEEVVTRIEVIPNVVTLNVDEDVQIEATIYPLGAVNEKLIWATGNAKVATVDENGIVTAVGAGETVLTVTADNGVMATVVIKVNGKVYENTETLESIVANNLVLTQLEMEDITADRIRELSMVEAWVTDSDPLTTVAITETDISKLQNEIGSYPVTFKTMQGTEARIVVRVVSNPIVNTETNESIQAHDFAISLDEVAMLDAATAIDLAYARAWVHDANPKEYVSIVNVDMRTIREEIGEYTITFTTEKGTTISCVVYVDANPVENIENEEVIQANNFTVFADEVSSLDDASIIQRARAKAWILNVTPREYVEITHVDYTSIKAEEGVYTVTFMTEKGTSISVEATVINRGQTNEYTLQIKDVTIPYRLLLDAINSGTIESLLIERMQVQLINQTTGEVIEDGVILYLPEDFNALTKDSYTIVVSYTRDASTRDSAIEAEATLYVDRSGETEEEPGEDPKEDPSGSKPEDVGSIVPEKGDNVKTVDNLPFISMLFMMVLSLGVIASVSKRKKVIK